MNMGVTFAMMLLCAGAIAGEFTGPWDLAALRQPPKAEWGETKDGVRSLYYPGEPLGGKPTRVFAYYAAPEKRQGRAPAMVLVHGGGGHAFPHWAAMWAKRGYAALAMDLSGCGPDGKRLPDGGPDQGHEDKFHTIGRGLRETWPYHMVAAVIRGTSLLAAQPEADPDRIGITGISWGGYLVCIVAGLDGRLKLAVPVYACGFLHENSCWLPELARQTDAERKLWIDHFEPSRYLGQARMPMLWVTGTNDFAYPLDSYQKSYRAAKGARTLSVTVRMPHGHEAGWAPAAIGLFADQVLRGGTPLPEVGPTRVKGNGVEVTYASATRIVSAGLHYTADTVTWDQRKWESRPAEVAESRVRATVPPARPITFFLTLTDSRGTTVSTEHRELK